MGSGLYRYGQLEREYNDLNNRLKNEILDPETAMQIYETMQGIEEQLKQIDQEHIREQ